MDIQGAIIRVLEYRIVKVPCSSGDAEVGDSVVLVVEEFEHVGSDGSSVFGDPRYVPINPAVRASLQRPAPPSPSKKDKNNQDYSFTQSLDPTDLLFLENTCTQTFQRQFVSFPQVISDADWQIPEDQIKILNGIRLIEIESLDYDRPLSDVELSEDEDEKTKRTKVVFPMSQSSGSSQNTQAPMTQMPMTQMSITQKSVSLASSTQTPPRSGPVVFPETQTNASYTSAILGDTQSSPIKISNLVSNTTSSPIKNARSSPMKNIMSSPVKNTSGSPIKNTMSSPDKNTMSSPVRRIETPVKQTATVYQSPMVENVIKSTIKTNSEAEIPSSPINSPIKKPVAATTTAESPTPKTVSEPVMEYPEYSSW